MIVAAALLQRRAGGDLARLLRDCARAPGGGRALEGRPRRHGPGALHRRVVVLLPAAAPARRARQPGLPRRPDGLVPDRLARGPGARAAGRRRGADPPARAAGAMIAGLSPSWPRRRGGRGPGSWLPARRGRTAGSSAPGALAACAARSLPSPRDLAGPARRRRPAGRARRARARWPRSSPRRWRGGRGRARGAAAPGRLGLLLAAGAPAAGFLAPDLWLARARRASPAEAPRAAAAARPAARDRRVRRPLTAALREVGRGTRPARGRVARGGRRSRSAYRCARRWGACARALPLPEVAALAPSRALAPPRRSAGGHARRSGARGARRAGARIREEARAPGRRSSWWSRCCWCRRCCCWSPRRWPRRCSTRAGALVRSRGSVRARNGVPGAGRTRRRVRLQRNSDRSAPGAQPAMHAGAGPTPSRSALPRLSLRTPGRPAADRTEVGSGVAKWEPVG